jgi:hypothetical protein
MIFNEFTLSLFGSSQCVNSAIQNFHSVATYWNLPLMEVFFFYDLNVGCCFLDVTPPKIQCPENIVVGTDPGEDYAAVNWTAPIATGKLEIQRMYGLCHILFCL